MLLCFVWSEIAEVTDLVYVLVGTLRAFLKTLTFGLLATLMCAFRVTTRLVLYDGKYIPSMTGE